MIGDRWGVDPDEVARRYPCDLVIPTPTLQAWRGVTVHTRPGDLWPWVGQLRRAPYSYDWIDNRGHESPQQLQDLAEPVPDEPFTAVGGRPTGRILSVEPGTQLTGQIMGAVMSYVLVPAGNPSDRATRLLLKIVSNHDRRLAPLICAGDLVMARRQLLNLSRLAEQSCR